MISWSVDAGRAVKEWVLAAVYDFVYDKVRLAPWRAWQQAIDWAFPPWCDVMSWCYGCGCGALGLLILLACTGDWSDGHPPDAHWKDDYSVAEWPTTSWSKGDEGESWAWNHSFTGWQPEWEKGPEWSREDENEDSLKPHLGDRHW